MEKLIEDKVDDHGGELQLELRVAFMGGTEKNGGKKEADRRLDKDVLQDKFRFWGNANDQEKKGYFNPDQKLTVNELVRFQEDPV